MKLKLADWSSIAEIVAAFGVILSLIFVGFQIRDGNRETVAATMQAALDSEILFQATVTFHADTWAKLTSGQELEEGEEATRGHLLYSMLMTVYENRFHQFELGYLDHPPSEVVVAANWPIYETWRLRGGAQSRSPEFLELLDEVRASSAK